MLIWCHRIVSGLVHLVLFLGTIFAMAVLYQRSGLFDAWQPEAAAVLLVVLVLCSMYYLGLPLAAAIEQSLPVRCPECRKTTMRAKRRAWHEVLLYRCGTCGHCEGAIEGRAEKVRALLR